VVHTLLFEILTPMLDELLREVVGLVDTEDELLLVLFFLFLLFFLVSLFGLCRFCFSIFLFGIIFIFVRVNRLLCSRILL